MARVSHVLPPAACGLQQLKRVQSVGRPPDEFRDWEPVMADVSHSEICSNLDAAAGTCRPDRIAVSVSQPLRGCADSTFLTRVSMPPDEFCVLLNANHEPALGTLPVIKCRRPEYHHGAAGVHVNAVLESPGDGALRRPLAVGRGVEYRCEATDVRFLCGTGSSSRCRFGDAGTIRTSYIPPRDLVVQQQGDDPVQVGDRVGGQGLVGMDLDLLRPSMAAPRRPRRSGKKCPPRRARSRSRRGRRGSGCGVNADSGEVEARLLAELAAGASAGLSPGSILPPMPLSFPPATPGGSCGSAGRAAVPGEEERADVSFHVGRLVGGRVQGLGVAGSSRRKCCGTSRRP